MTTSWTVSTAGWTTFSSAYLSHESLVIDWVLWVIAGSEHMLSSGGVTDHQEAASRACSGAVTSPTLL